MKVARKRTEVNAIQVTWAEVENHIEGLERSKHSRLPGYIYPQTGEFDPEEFAPNLLLEEDFEDGPLWVIGPFPDGGYELATDEKFRTLFEEV